MLFGAIATAGAMALSHAAPTVNIVQHNDTFTINASFEVAAKPEVVFDVLTDFDKMPKFMPSVSTSKIVSSSPNKYRVRQTGKVSVGLFNASYDSTKDIEVIPGKEIKATSLDSENGDMTSTTKVIYKDR
jgi:ribosome-associated toxin RatA of RatAB toxin-antitoxin module